MQTPLLHFGIGILQFSWNLDHYLEKYAKMSELVWGIKNGDIDQVKQIIENKVKCPQILKHALINFDNVCEIAK